MKKEAAVKRERKKIPTGVKVIAILNFICAGILILLGTLLVFAGAVIGSNPSKFAESMTNSLAQDSSMDSAAISQTIGSFIDLWPYILVMGILWVVIAVFSLVVGIYLWKSRKWARNAEIVFLGLQGALILMSLGGGVMAWVFNILILAVDVFIIAYLVCSKEVKKSFN